MVDETDSDWDPFGEEFDSAFEEMDKQDRMYNRLDAGFENWEERYRR